MKFVSKLILCWILALQLGAGNAIAQVGAVGVVGNRVETSKKFDKDQPNPDQEDVRPNSHYLGNLSKVELQIDTMAEADEYVQSTMDQAKWFEEQCAERKNGDVYMKWDSAFVLRDNIPYGDMDIKNCSQEHEKLSHMVNVAKTLTEHFGTEETLINKNCADCSVSQVFDDNSQNPDYIPPGDKCSLGVQAKMEAENCSFLKALGSAVTHWSCIGNLLKGIVKGFWDAIKGIGHLLAEGLKWCGKQIKKGWNAVKVFFGFKKAETQADQGILAVSQKKQEEYEKFKKDQEGWVQKSAEAAWNVIKEIAYVGMYERETKCMNCREKGDLLCEIGGRIFNDVIGFTFTLGVGYGAIATMTKQLASKLGPITAKLTSKFAAAAERGGLVSKTRNLAWKATNKTVKFVGRLPVRMINSVSAKTKRLWAGFKKTHAYKVIANPKNPNRSFMGAVKWAGKTVPGKIIVKPVAWTGKQLGRYMRWDQRIFSKGTYYGALTGVPFGWTTKAEALALKAEMLPKLDKPKVDIVMEDGYTMRPTYNFKMKNGTGSGELVEVLHNDQPIVARLEKRPATKGAKGLYNRVTGEGKTDLAATVDYRVWEYPKGYLEQNADKVAELKRAGVEIPEMINGHYPDVDGKVTVQLKANDFKKLYRGKFETPTRKLTVKVNGEKKVIEIPMDKKGIVLIKYENKIIERPAKSITKKDLLEYQEKRAVLTTKEHPDAETLINPNKVDPQLISTNIQDPGRMVFVSNSGEVSVYKAANVTPEFVKNSEGKGFFIRGGTDNPAAIMEYGKKGFMKDAENMADTELQKVWDARVAGKTDEATELALKEVQELGVAIPLPREQISIAQNKLISKYSGKKSGSLGLREMDDNWWVEATEKNVGTKNNHIEVQLIRSEKPTKLPFKSDPSNPVDSVYAYQNETKVIVRKKNGEAYVYDVSKGDEGVKLAEFEKADAKVVNTAMGEMVDAKQMSIDEIKKVRENLLLQNKKEGVDFYVTPDGKNLRINLPKECNPKWVDIPLAI